ncbi:MAG: Signal recognition particle receptor FtsY [Methanomicrobiales archaeon 53_19]|jgi:fused signal recognition particle receptor|uniref:signal recognition particle-docking protein FtsY n=1 Tax=Methanocalculus sp. TaxID=2004547 RepID=UPI00074740A1|nr:signal recognition particle-docking protein FtsY [Methanocalculus sp.]KUK70961.1 MAG: Signal recognition particle receptor FtsY [Methanocalculus sp. 52_23]KUL04843.1 MAG: Signal recognition particle receptor FtsY [Methanomicrobiales archaeon 53_19]HIJ06091.1 signal recognition particle-docking protein FtsY [Methanocalculus sp.]
MFEGLKNKLKGVRSRFGASIEEHIEESPVVSLPSQEIYAGEESSHQAESIPEDHQVGELSGKRIPPSGKETNPQKDGFFTKVKTLVTEREFILSEKDLEEPLFELEMILLESDVALSVTDAIIAHMRQSLIGNHRKIRQSPDEIVTAALKNALREVLGEGLDLVGFIRSHEKPVKILFTGVNGTGKTTSIAKVGAFLRKEGFSVVIGAGDTYRAGATEQIRVHAERLGIRLIHHQEGADPSAVLFDAVEYAQAHGVDVVLADTAGRFHNRANLMSQLEKIRRIFKPDLIFYVDEATAGNDAVVRAAEFEKTIGADGVMLTKVDMDKKGGSAISIAHTIGKPLVFLGVGQEYEDIVHFTPDLIINEILGDDA